MARSMGRSTGAGMKDAQIKFRAPGELYKELQDAAKQHGWGLSEEIRARLERPVAGMEDPWFADLLTAIGHAAAGAAKLKRENPNDTTPYVAFQEAVHALIMALAPEGRASASDELGMRLAYRLVALALGALGQRGIEAFASLPDVDREFMEKHL
jgi:hypothetical protein